MTDQVFDLVIVVAGQNNVGILTDGVGVVDDLGLAGGDGEGYLVHHLAGGLFTGHNVFAVVIGLSKCHFLSVQLHSGGSRVRKGQIEIHTDAVAQSDIPFDLCRIACGKYGCRYHGQNHDKCQQQGEYAVCRFVHVFLRFLSLYFYIENYGFHAIDPLRQPVRAATSPKGRGYWLSLWESCQKSLIFD